MEEFEQGTDINKDSSSCCAENRLGKVAKSGSGKTSCEATGKKHHAEIMVARTRG